MVVFAAWAALSLSCTSLVFGVTDGVTVGVLAWTALPAGELWLDRSWHLSPKRSRKDFTPTGKRKQHFLFFLIIFKVTLQEYLKNTDVLYKDTLELYHSCQTRPAVFFFLFYKKVNYYQLFKTLLVLGKCA